MAWSWPNPGSPYLWKYLIGRQIPLTKVLFFGVMVTQEWAFLGKHTVFVPSSVIQAVFVFSFHLSSSLPVHDSDGKLCPAGHPWTSCMSVSPDTHPCLTWHCWVSPYGSKVLPLASHPLGHFVRLIVTHWNLRRTVFFYLVLFVFFY